MGFESERRLVTVLVTDVVDSTPIAERLGAERYKTLFDEIARITREQVERFGGTVAQHTGDGVLALFGAPTAHEDDSTRAVRAALAVHEALRPFAREVGDAYGVAVAARAAVNTGPALVLRGDEPPDQLYNALGDTVTVAARLQSHAGTGGTVLGPLTARQVEDVFDLDPLGGLELKGRAESVPAFRVTGERERPVAHALTPLAGRDTELATVVAALEGLADGRGAVIVVTGEPGIGKSRLVAEARERTGNGVRFVEGSAVAYAETFPYWPVRAALRDWLGVGASAPDAQVRLELRTELLRLLPARQGAYAFVATVIGAPLDDGEARTIAGLTPDSVRRQTHETLCELLLSLARERPLCLVLDDLQWGDESTLDLLVDLLDTTEEEAIGLLLVLRSERDHGAWELAHHARQRLPHRYSEVELKPLDGDASRALVVGAAAAPLPDEVVAVLSTRAGGNPFFLEQALRDLVEQGAVRQTSGRFELVAGVGELAVPAVVQEALQARLGRLGDPTRALVGAASVVGRSFAVPLLEQLLPGERLTPALAELQRLDLVVEERRRPVVEYRFRHGLVQEVAYASLPEEHRRDLHRRTARALERLHRESPDEIAGLLAHHHAEGGDRGPAARWFERAGDAARAQYANDEAVAHYRRAVGLLDETGSTDDARHVLFKIGIGHVAAFEFPQAAAAYRDAFARPSVRPRAAVEPTETVSLPHIWEFESLVPGHGYSTSSWWMTQHVYRGLLRFDRDRTVLPDLAESFELSDDGLRYAFRLRDDVRWHDGTPVTAEDFAWTWSRMREERVVTAHLLEPISEARAVDERTLELRLDDPSNTLLYVLSLPPAFPWPRHLRASPDPSSRAPVGNGPFTTSDTGDGSLRFVATADWPLSRGNVREVEAVITTIEEANADWESGLYDADLSFVVKQPAAAPDDRVDIVDLIAAEYLAIRPVAPFDDVRLRRAIAHAVDRRGWVEGRAAFGVAREPADGGLISPLMPGHLHDIALAHDVERARALLAEAGHAEGEGIGEITILLPDILERPVGEVLAAQLARVGLEARVERLPWPAYVAAVGEGHLYWTTWVPDLPDPSAVVESYLASYPWVHHDDELMALLGRARATRDRDERLRLYGQADRMMVVDHVSVIPLCYSRGWRITRRPWISGVWSNGYMSSCLDEAVVDPTLRADADPGGASARPR